MIDIHTHVLPGIDDGSKSVAESLELLRMLKNQGISKVAATPHFYANQMSLDSFLGKRREAYSKLMDEYSEDLPEVLLGAEVKFYQGISRLEGLERLRIGNSKLLLLEMPFSTWTEYTVREVSELAMSGNVRVVLAHIERYIRYQDKKLVSSLVENGILIQSNAEFFLNFASRRKALNMLSENLIHFIGSDCHNLTSRPPRIGDAYEFIRRKTSDRFLLQMSDFAHSLIL